MTPSSLQRIFSFRILLQFLLFTAGAVCTYLASWIFYLSPWLHLSADFDAWLERNRCLIDSWCHNPIVIASPLGILFALGALGAFSLAMWMAYGMPVRWKATLDMRQTVFIQITLLITMISAVLFQALQLVYYKTTPAGIAWLLGIGSLFAFGLTLERQQSTLKQSCANLLIALGLLLTLLGTGGLLLQTENFFWTALIFGAGVIFFALGSRWATQLSSSFTRTDHALMILLAVLHLALALRYAWSWHFAFVGDEWGFFEVARALNHGANDLKWFETRDSNGFHTVFSMQLQAWVMQLVGEHVAAWRLSSILPAAFSIPAIYVLGHGLGGRQTATLSAGIFAVSHTLLCFAMVPYNNTQALFPMTVGMALFVFASQRGGSLRYLLIGMVLGLSFLVYGLARLAIIPVGLFWLVHPWPNGRTAMRRLVEIGSGAFVVAAPILLNLESWLSLLKATPVQSEVSPAELTLAAQIGRNVISGLLAFLTNPANTHFVIGPYVDPLTAIFVLIGASYLLVTIGRQRMATGWLIGSLLLLIAISGIQQYSRIATTRMFSTVSIFALYAGVGGTAFFKFLLPANRWLQAGSVVALLAALIFINQYHISHVTLPNSEKPDIPLIIQQFQKSTAADGNGMPVFVVENDPYNSMLKLILPAYNIRQERIILLTPDEVLQVPHACNVGQGEAMLIMSIKTPKAAEIRNRLAECWPGYTEIPLRNRAEEITLYRFTTTKAQAMLHLSPAGSQQRQRAAARLFIPGAQALAAAPDGTFFVLSAAEQKVIHYSATGQQLHAFSVVQKYPTTLAVDGQERIIVAGGEAKLIWYDLRGNIIQKTSAVRELYRPFSLGIINHDELIVSDIEQRQLAHLSKKGELIETFKVPGVELPGALVVSTDQKSIWLYDVQAGMITEVALADQTILHQISARQNGAEDAVALAMLSNQTLLQTIPGQRRMIQTSLNGEILRIWGGFDRPTAIAITGNKQILVLDRNLEQIHLLSPIDAGTADQEAPKPINDFQEVTGSKATIPVSPLSPVPTPVSK